MDNCLVKELYNTKKEELSSWCNCAKIKSGDDLERTDSIIANIAKEVNEIERLLNLDEVSRGLNIKVVKKLVDKHFEEVYQLGEDGEWIDKKEK